MQKLIIIALTILGVALIALLGYTVTHNRDIVIITTLAGLLGTILGIFGGSLTGHAVGPVTDSTVNVQPEQGEGGVQTG